MSKFRKFIPGLAALAIVMSGSAFAQSGGGVFNREASVTITNSTISGNTIEADQLRWGDGLSLTPPEDNGPGRVELTISADPVEVRRGGAGNDVLIGGRGNDIMLGQDGSDLLIVNDGDGSDFMFKGVEVLKVAATRQGTVYTLSYKSFSKA